MRIDELYKFNDGTLNDVLNALDDRLKGIRMQYLPQTIWRKGDKDRAAAIIQAIDKMLKTWRIMRSLKRFVVDDCMRETSGCYKVPYDSSYANPIFTEYKLDWLFDTKVLVYKGNVFNPPPHDFINAKIEEELVETKSRLEHRGRQAEEIQGSIASFFLSDIARLEPNRVAPSHLTSSATTSLRANTHVRHSTSSSRNFGHTSTPEHLKKKKKSVEKGGPSAI
nr:hypothetical protein [Tanacetum cinerariifolium]